MYADVCLRYPISCRTVRVGVHDLLYLGLYLYLYAGTHNHGTAVHGTWWYDVSIEKGNQPACGI